VSQSAQSSDYDSSRDDDLREWSDAELQAAYDDALVTTSDIKRQLADDDEDGRRRGGEWRGKARAARRYAVQMADRVWREMDRRKSAARTIKNANHVQSLRELQEKNERLREKLRTFATERDASKAQCEMFVKAAHRVFSRDECDRIWQRARELFPDAAAWGNSNDEARP
jgi:hypothetical protein